jgi:uncharacterized protein DUF928
MEQGRHSSTRDGLLGAICALALCLVLAPALAQQQADDDLQYQPPKRGTPSGRVGGGTRGVQAPRLAALAPEHVGHTLRAQPVLYYFAPQGAAARLVLQPANDADARPLVERELPAPARAGIQRVDLAALGITLAPDVDYRWTLATTRDKSSGAIRRVAPSPELAAKLPGASGRQRYALLAREGIWYDALDEVSRAVDAAPANIAPARHRAMLLEQIGLYPVARYERQRYE